MTTPSPHCLGWRSQFALIPGCARSREEEAIYFRGREEHVTKCLGLLAAERFVMITGASGDGKSSLVFAGLLPEVRAGFLRGRYSSWAVATFRPERSPLRNMARALAPALRLRKQRGSHRNGAGTGVFGTGAALPGLGTVPARRAAGRPHGGRAAPAPAAGGQPAGGSRPV